MVDAGDVAKRQIAALRDSGGAKKAQPMKAEDVLKVDVSWELIEAVKSWPRQKKTEHCENVLMLDPFAVDTTCPTCGKTLKLRHLSDRAEIPDVFDAVFKWIVMHDADSVAEQRVEDIREFIREEKEES